MIIIIIIYCTVEITLNVAQTVSTEQLQHCIQYKQDLFGVRNWKYFLVFLSLQHCGLIFTARYRAIASSFSRFLDHTQRRPTFGRNPLDEWSIRRRDIYLTTHNTHNRQTSMLPAGFQPIISAGEWPKTYVLDRAAAGTGS